MYRKTALAAVLLTGSMFIGGTPVMAQTEVKMIGFGGATNLPSWVAIDKGFSRRKA